MPSDEVLGLGRAGRPSWVRAWASPVAIVSRSSYTDTRSRLVVSLRIPSTRYSPLANAQGLVRRSGSNITQAGMHVRIPAAAAAGSRTTVCGFPQEILVDPVVGMGDARHR